MYGFLRTPRWLVGHVLVVVVVISFTNLGFWQLRRLDERREHNAMITQRLQAAPVALDELLQTAGTDPATLEYRRVTVQGTYRSGDQVLTAPRSRDGRPGPQVLTVLDRDAGPPVLVDRGWIPFVRGQMTAPDPPAGDIRVEGILRAREPGDIGTGEQVARIVPAQIGERLGQPLPEFYVELWDQQPAPSASDPLPAEAPVLSEGNHQSYAVQWFAFALIAALGYPALIWRTARERSGGNAREPSAGEPEQPASHAPLR